MKKLSAARTAWALVTTMILLPIHAAAVQYDVYILTGQSNSLGTTGTADSLVSPGVDAADANTKFWWANVTSSNSVYPAGLYGDSAGTFTALQVQQGDGGANPVFWGPEFGFARTLSAIGGNTPLIIKASRGGGSNNLWDKATFDASGDAGHMWGHLRDTVDSALAAIGPGDSFRVRGLLYMQGESNTSGDAAVAGSRLDALATNLIAHINAAHSNAAVGMKTVVAEIAASSSTAARATTTATQRTFAVQSDAVAFVGTTDLLLKSDGIHFGGYAKLEIGSRMANAMAGRGLAATTFDALSGVDGARSLVFDLAVPDGNGATNGAIQSFVNPYEGFLAGSSGQPPAGVRIEGASGSVVFADYYGTLTTSDLAAGGQTANANSGQSLTFTFLDPVTRRAAVVAGVAFELRAVTGDNVTATFLDADGVVLHQTGVLSDGRIGYESYDSFTNASRSLIHQVVLSGSSGTLWTAGHAGDAVTADFAFTGFTVVPEPSAIGIAIGGAVTAAVCFMRRRRPRVNRLLNAG